MKGKFFLDTNVLVYSFDRSAPAKARRALELIRQAVANGNGIISYQVAQEFLHLAMGRFERRMSLPEAEQYLATVLGPLMAVPSSQALYSSALHLCGAEGLSWRDSLIVAAALSGQCEVLYSEKLQHGRQFTDLKVRNPFL